MRKLASIQKILDIQPIPGADRIQVATVLGWKVVIRKDEFKVGDLAIYVEIDSLLPFTPWTEFLRDKNRPDKPIRLRTVRLKKQLSQGILFSVAILSYRIGQDYQEGEDVTELLGIQKWEPEIPAQLKGMVKGGFPACVPKTDETRVQAEPGLIQEFQGKRVYITQKVDGTSGTFVVQDDIDVCSRNLSLKETEGNTYWEIFKKYNLEAKLKAFRDRYQHALAIQGEIAGPGIQKNRLGLKEVQLFVFNIYDITAGRYLDFEQFKKLCEEFELQTVPILEVRTFDFCTVDELLELARGQYASGKNQEGIVIRPVQECYSEILNGRASFKVINNEFLLETGE